MDGSNGKYGAVAMTQSIMNPVHAAHHVMAQDSHKLLVGAAAEAVAFREGLAAVSNDFFTTDERQQQLAFGATDSTANLGTVGALMLDQSGRLAAAGSTGGCSGKTKGRIGDTAIPGAGIYADTSIAVIW